MTPEQTAARSKKAAATRMARYGPNVFKDMGRVGGKRPKPKRIDDLPMVEQYEVVPGDAAYKERID